MPDKGSMPTLVDVYLLDKQLKADRGRPLEQLQERDHALGQACVGATDTHCLQHWLGSVKAGESASASRISEAQAALVLRLLGLVSGLLAMGGFLLASERALVNVFLLMLFFVLIPLVLSLISAWVMLLSLRGSTPGVFPLSPARFVARWALPDPGYLKQGGSLLRMLVLKYAQEFALLFALGAITAFIGLLAFNDFGFVWGSTLGLSEELVSGLTGLMAAPWQTLLPAALLSPEVVNESRMHAAQMELSELTVHSRRAWWPFLFMCLAVYTLLPRLLLWLAARRIYRKAVHKAFLAVPGAGGVLARMRRPVVKTQATDTAHEDSQQPQVIREQGAVLLEWAGALGTASTQWEVDEHLQGGLGSPADDLDSIERVNQLRPEHLLVAVKGWEPPMADLADVLSEIDSVRRCTLQLVSLPGRELGEAAFRDWQAFSRQLPFAMTDVVALGSSE